MANRVISEVDMPAPAVTAALISGGFGALEGIGNWMGGGTRRNLEKQNLLMQRWRLARQKQMFAQIQAMLKSGTTFGGGRKGQMMAQHRQRLAPALSKIRSFAGTTGSLSSPEAHRMIAQQYLPMEAGYSSRLDEMDLGNLQNLRQGLLRMVV
jgi:hypothetical protein